MKNEEKKPQRNDGTAVPVAELALLVECCLRGVAGKRRRVGKPPIQLEREFAGDDEAIRRFYETLLKQEDLDASNR